MKLFKTNNIDVVTSCHSFFDVAYRVIYGQDVWRNWTRPVWHATKYLYIMVINLLPV